MVDRYASSCTDVINGCMEMAILIQIEWKMINDSVAFFLELRS